MLTFLTGTYFPSKKIYINEKIRSLLEDGERVYLIVPEQSSFDRDRDFLLTYGEKLSNKLTVTSFTHLSRDVLEDNGLRVMPEADEAARNVLMSLAAEECAEELDIYRRHSAKGTLVKKLLGEYSEIRQAGLDTNDIFKVSALLPEGILKQKTGELARIFSVYESFLTDRFSEAADNLAVMTRFLKENNIFRNSYVFFDDFRGFTGAQIKLIGEIISGAKESSISVFAPDSVTSYDSEAFSHAVRNCRKIRSLATLRGIKCEEVKISEPHPVAALDALRSSLFCTEKEVYEDEAPPVTISTASDKYSECDMVALQINKLLEEGYRCRDISVCERSGGYAKALAASLKKYGIPVFEDKRVPLTEYPLVKMLLSALNIAAYGFSTDEVFSYIKTGITGIDTIGCSELENYVYIWQIDKRSWVRPFTGHPDGFGEKENDSTKERLININAVREKLTAPLIALRKKLEKNEAGYSCRAVFEFLTEIGASENFLSYAKSLFESGNEAAAIECSAVWDTVMESLDALHEAVSGRSVSPRRFYELFKIILSSGDIGRIPAGIDQIVIGTAGRTRHLEPRAVFVLGCNEGVFPETPVSGGLFTSSERRILSKNDFPLENIPENIYAEERMIAYSVLTNATEKLFVSYSRADSTGAKAEPSEIIGEIEKILPFAVKADDRNLSPVDKIGSEESAFEQCAALFGENNTVSASLKEYVSTSAMSDRLGAVKSAAEKAPAKIENCENAVALFGENMYMSPSKAEVYYTCAFKYFCQYGMNLKKLRIADLDARINGLLIHHLLENILISKSNKELTLLSENELRELISDITEDFISEFMGGRDDKSVLLNRSLDRTKETAFAILSRMIQEFSESRFETVDVELNIGSDGEITPYNIALPDGGSITVGGKVDRVDVMNDSGKAYIRVVDYKTGGKDFKLSDVFDGLNMQMLIYLMCIWTNGVERYGDIVPAGILYVPANNSGSTLSRRDGIEKIEEQKLKNGRMNGMILEDMRVLEGMEKGCKGRFINAYIDKKGVMKGTFLSLNGFRALHEKIDSVLREMGMGLHTGNIAAMPLIASEDKSPCIYCDYKDICRRSSGDEHRTPLNVSHAKAVELLKGSEENG
ncbi:MAG: PD-(D/E)XK nuclease family protein [Clostridia bacterium]|nr:PD-(D/E)XK nuclease family protein [Clostridia bacterium]